MKYCTSCGAQNEDHASFCCACGAAFSGAATNASENQAQANPVGTDMASMVNPADAAKLTRLFHLSSDERIIASIGNNYLQNLLSGASVSKTIAVATNRRLYYHGRAFDVGSAKVSRATASASVLLKDISFTGLIHSNPVWKKVLALVACAFAAFCALGFFVAISEGDGANIVTGFIMFAISAALSVLFFRSYKATAGTMFWVYFPGGKLRFNMKYYSEKEREVFQECLTRLVDQAKR